MVRGDARVWVAQCARDDVYNRKHRGWLRLYPGAVPTAPCDDAGIPFELVIVFRFLQVLFAVGQPAVLAAVERRQHLSRSQIVERDAGQVTIAKVAGEDWTCFWIGARRSVLTFHC